MKRLILTIADEIETKSTTSRVKTAPRSVPTELDAKGGDSLALPVHEVRPGQVE